MEKEITVQCPTCKKKFEFDTDLEVGDTTYCPECYEELEVESTSPVRVKIVEKAEGWDDGGESDGLDEQ
jgi:transcription initiation factor IIE alpha subunit